MCVSPRAIGTWGGAGSQSPLPSALQGKLQPGEPGRSGDPCGSHSGAINPPLPLPFPAGAAAPSRPEAPQEQRGPQAGERSDGLSPRPRGFLTRALPKAEEPSRFPAAAIPSDPGTGYSQAWPNTALGHSCPWTPSTDRAPGSTCCPRAQATPTSHTGESSGWWKGGQGIETGGQTHVKLI